MSVYILSTFYTKMNKKNRKYFIITRKIKQNGSNYSNKKSAMVLLLKTTNNKNLRINFRFTKGHIASWKENQQQQKRFLL